MYVIIRDYETILLFCKLFIFNLLHNIQLLILLILYIKQGS